MLDRVERIAVVDSRWNGELIGAAAGVAATALLVASARDSDDSYASLLWLFPGPLIVIGGAEIGGLIDGAHNRTVYDRRSVAKITFVPVRSDTRVGVMARISF